MAIELTDILVALGNFPLLEDISLLGGFRTVANTTERDAIDPTSRKVGMFVWLSDDAKLYRLSGGIDNADWVEVPLGSGGSPNDFVVVSSAPENTDKVFTSVEAALAAANGTDGVVRILFTESFVIGNGEASVSVDFSNVILVGNAGGRASKSLLINENVTITALPLAIENLELILSANTTLPAINANTFLVLRDAKITSSGAPTTNCLISNELHISLYGASSLVGTGWLEVEPGPLFINAYDEAVVEETTFLGTGTVNISLFGDSRTTTQTFAGTKTYRTDGANAFYQEIPNDQSDYELEPFPSQIVYIIPGGSPQPITIHIPTMSTTAKNDRNWILIKDATGTASTNTITVVADGGGGIETGTNTYVINQDYGAVLLRFVTDNLWVVAGSHKATGAVAFQYGDFPIDVSNVFVGPGGTSDLHVFVDGSGGNRATIVYNVTVSAAAPFGEYASFQIVGTFTRGTSTITEREIVMVNGPSISDNGFNVFFEVIGTTITMQADSPFESYWRAFGFITVTSGTFGEA